MSSPAMTRVGAPARIVAMGVSGCGKTTVGREIAAVMGWEFVEGDSFHSPANVAKMSSGTPLTDKDRWPWLRAIGAWLDGRSGRSMVLTCSALKRTYRDLLRDGRAGVRFCELDAPEGIIAARLAARTGHYMPASLLASQLATLEPLQPDEPGVRVSSAEPHPRVVADALRALGLVPADGIQGTNGIPSTTSLGGASS